MVTATTKILRGTVYAGRKTSVADFDLSNHLPHAVFNGKTDKTNNLLSVKSFKQQ